MVFQQLSCQDAAGLTLFIEFLRDCDCLFDAKQTSAQKQNVVYTYAYGLSLRGYPVAVRPLRCILYSIVQGISPLKDCHAERC